MQENMPDAHRCGVASLDWLVCFDGVFGGAAGAFPGIGEGFRGVGEGADFGGSDACVVELAGFGG